MKLINNATGQEPRPGDVLAYAYPDPIKHAVLAGWDKSTTLLHVWPDPNDVGDLSRTVTYSTHYFGCEWVAS